MSETQKPKPKKAEQPVPATLVELLSQEELQDKKFFRWSIGFAVILHIFIFAFH